MEPRYTLKHILLRPREFVPFPGTDIFPSYRDEHYPTYPIYNKKNKKKEELFSGYVPVVVAGDSAFTKIANKSGPTEVARFETVASEQPFISSSQQQPKLFIPPPVTRAFYHPHDGLTDKSNPVVQRYFMQGLYSSNDSSPSNQQLPLQQVIVSPDAPAVQRLYITDDINVPSVTTATTTALSQPPSSSPSQQSSHLRQQHLLHQKFIYYAQQQQQNHERMLMCRDSAQASKTSGRTNMVSPCDKSATEVSSSYHVTPSPSSSAIGLTQIRAMYDERHRKNARNGKRRSTFSSASSLSSPYSVNLYNYHDYPRSQNRPPITKKARTIFSDSQSADMLRVFRQTPYISAKQRSQMAQHLEIPEETISVWFKNQRSKLKKKMSLMYGGTSALGSSPRCDN